MASAEDRRFLIRRISGFLKQFGRSKRGFVGISLLVLFVGAALGAPWIASDPVRPSSQFVAGGYAAPSWVNFGTSAQLYSANLFPINDPGFSSSSSIASWNVNSSADPSAVTVRYDPQAGRPFPGSGPGSLNVQFKRDAATPPFGKVVIRIFVPFQYPYPASPSRIIGNAYVFPDASANVNYTAFIVRTGEGGCPISKPMIVNPDGSPNPYVVGLYPGCYPLSQLNPGSLLDRWLSLGTMDTLSGETLNVFFPGLNSSQPDPGREIFRHPGNYAFGLEMAFQDQTLGAVNVSIHFDDVNLRLLGKNYGLLGTDQFGVDLFSQLIYGARVSLLVGLLSAVISVVVGLLVGLVAGYIGGITDEVLMRFTDMLLVLPFLPLLIVMIAILGASIWNVILVISLLGWMGFARVVRSQVLSLKERPFVEAARAAGAGAGRIIRTHVVPNVMSLTYVTLALSVPAAIVAEAALSFLGLSDVTVTSWGHTIYNAENFNGFRNLWWVIPPGLAIATVSLSFILLGYALDEVLNPKLRLRR